MPQKRVQSARKNRRAIPCKTEQNSTRAEFGRNLGILVVNRRGRMQERGKMGRLHVVTVDQYDYQEAIKGIGRYGRFEQCVLLNEIRPDFVEGQLRMPGGFFTFGLFDSRDAAIEELERRYTEHEKERTNNYARKSE